MGGNMQHKLTLTEVTIPRQGIADLELTLRLWNDGADPDTDPPADTRIFSKQSKTDIEGLTLDQLLARIEGGLTSEIQTYIDTYKKQEQIKTKPAVVGMVSSIEGNLVS